MSGNLGDADPLSLSRLRHLPRLTSAVTVEGERPGASAMVRVLIFESKPRSMATRSSFVSLSYGLFLFEPMAEIPFLHVCPGWAYVRRILTLSAT